eukprot:CAMPEP_0181102082 /NCGR_PEP_ID=MMETSP1071-20121207/14117_1 /TAXON_ID=35127 /ORGANISM="Thalassiosira sp., Strain NH16" /LENGTH=144 /DNA_ID=CAMNT_0023185015 /DNA_START=204 /DNA_END=639 /DNA_ORIENTATION=+
MTDNEEDNNLSEEPKIDQSTDDDDITGESSVSSSSPVMSSGTNGDTANNPEAIQTAKESAEGGGGGGVNGGGFTLILVPTLLFKFAIVMLIKFATDIVVFPLLFAYRFARMGKRKFTRGLRRLFGREGDDDGANVKVNGDSGSS